MPKKKFEISTVFTADDKFSRRVRSMSQGLKSMRKVANRTGRAIAKIGKAAKVVGMVGFRALKVGAGVAVVALTGVIAAVVSLSKQFSKIEDARANFTPLLGSAEKARDMVDAINKTAASTPFQFETLASTVEQLLPSMNGNIEETIGLTRMLGDTAGGNAQKMESITRGYNKALIKNKVDLESLNMIAEAGVPIFQQLADKMGVSTTKLFKMITAGKVKTEDLTATFKKMTGEGGIFFKGMEIASKTLSGKISTLKDNVSLAAAEFGSALSPVLKELADEATGLAQGVAKWARENKDLIATKFREWVFKIRDGIKSLYKWFKKNWPEIKKTAAHIWDFAKGAKELAVFVWKNKYAIAALITSFGGLKLAMSGANLIGVSEDMAKINGSTNVASAATSRFGKVLQSVGMIASSFMVGYAIGDSFDTYLMKPMRRAADNLSTVTENMVSRISMNLRKMNGIQRDQSESYVADRIKTMDSFSAKTAAFLSGNLSQHNRALDAARKTLSMIQQETAVVSSRAGLRGADIENMMDTSSDELNSLAGLQRGGGGASPFVAAPTNSTRTEKTEVTIKDSTGKATITKGKGSKGLKLVRTGGM